MNRSFYIDLANRGLKMPMGTDIVLNEHPDPEAIRSILTAHRKKGGYVAKECRAERKSWPLRPQQDLWAVADHNGCAD